MIYNKFKNIFKTKKIYEYAKPKILVDDFNLIYHTMLEKITNENFLEKQIKDIENSHKKRINNARDLEIIKHYSSILRCTIYKSIKHILNEEKFHTFLSYSNYYSTSTDIISVTSERLISAYFNSILDFESKLKFFKEKSVFFEIYKPFNEPENFRRFLSNEILKNLQISHSYAGSIYFTLNDFYSIIKNYLLEYTYKIRDNHEEFHENRNNIQLEINRAKLIYEKNKEFSFLKEYTDKLKEIFENLNLVKDPFKKEVISESLKTKRINNEMLKKLSELIKCFFKDENENQLNTSLDFILKKSKNICDYNFNMTANVKSYCYLLSFLVNENYTDNETVIEYINSFKIIHCDNNKFDKKVFGTHKSNFEKQFRNKKIIISSRSSKEMKLLSEFITYSII